MSEVSVEETKWIENYLIPSILKNRRISRNSVRSEISFPSHVFFRSVIYFLTLTFESGEKKDEKASENTLQLVVKKRRLGTAYDSKMHMEKHFHNEILFYTKFARWSSLFPRCVYTAEGGIEESVIVTENITTMGYDICAEAYDIPLEYVLAAVEAMGKLHAMAYVMKEREPEEFKRIVDDIQEARYLVEGTWLTNFLNIIATRPVDWLRKIHYEPKFCDRLEKYFGNAYEKVMLEFVKPVEPLATLCHGDFTRNNIFFRKNNDKMEAMPFDFAVITYTSPAIDLATLLYLNASTHDRVEKFDIIFGVYHKALITNLRDAGITDLDKYSYGEFLADYKRHALFGFMIAVYFLPMTRGLCSPDFEEYSKDFSRAARIIRAAGGEAMTEEFGKMILHFKESGCLDHLFSYE